MAAGELLGPLVQRLTRGKIMTSCHLRTTERIPTVPADRFGLDHVPSAVGRRAGERIFVIPLYVQTHVEILAEFSDGVLRSNFFSAPCRPAKTKFQRKDLASKRVKRRRIQAPV